MRRWRQYRGFESSPDHCLLEFKMTSLQNTFLSIKILLDSERKRSPVFLLLAKTSFYLLLWNLSNHIYEIRGGGGGGWAVIRSKKGELQAVPFRDKKAVW